MATYVLGSPVLSLDNALAGRKSKLLVSCTNRSKGKPTHLVIFETRWGGWQSRTFSSASETLEFVQEWKHRHPRVFKLTQQKATRGASIIMAKHQLVKWKRGWGSRKKAVKRLISRGKGKPISRTLRRGK